MPKNGYFVLAISWTLLVVVLCLISFNNLPSTGVKGADKYIHAFFHFVFTVLWYLYFESKYKLVSSEKMLFLVVVMSLLFGVLLEILQGILTETRQPDMLDVAANFTGALLALVCLYCYHKFIQKPPN